jgi:DNA-binding beta-propeller fold protein YncE
MADRPSGPAPLHSRLSLRAIALSVALLIASAITLWPALALGMSAGVNASDPAPASELLANGWSVLLRSVLWALGGAAAGVLLAWPASRAFRRDPASLGNQACAAFVLLGVMLPPWLSYAALWMSTGPGTLAGDFFERADAMPALRAAILSVSIASWCAGIAFVVLLVLGPRRIVTDGRLLALDRATPLRRLSAAAARDARALVVAFVAACVFLLGETTAFDLAQVGTFGFELRTLDAIGASPGTVLLAALPVVGVIAAVVALVPAFARGLGDDALRSRGAERPRSGTSMTAPGLTLAWAALPMALVAFLVLRAVVSVPRAGDFLALHGASLSSAALCASAAAAIAAVLGAGLRVALEGGARIRRTAIGLGLVLLAAGLSPATLTALAAEAAYNRQGLAPIYDSAAIVVILLAARAAPIAVLVAVALAAREAPAAARLRALDGGTLRGAWRGARGEIVLAASVTGATALVWSVSELIASGRVAPPGLRWMATDVLNAIHYQRPDTVILFAGAMLVLGFAGLILVLRLLSRLARAIDPSRAWLLAVSAAALLAIPGCGRDPAGSPAADPELDPEMRALRAATPAVERALAVEREFAGVGRGKGQFNSPRVVAHDARDGWTYVIDKDARVQRFATDGTVLSEWTMPKSDRGKPVGATVSPAGDLVVADTHEHRVVCFSPSGELLWTLGGYGKGDGEFIYPTDIAFAPDGRIFVAEYGGNDRIQVFDAARRYLYQFGRCGTEPGAFLRPQALALDAERDELFVADAGNHRIQVFTTDGELRRTLGSVGAEQGRFSYPFGVVLEIGGVAATPVGLPSGGIDAAGARRTLVVAEHSNHRIQRIDAATGESLALAGGLGRGKGRLKYAWAVVEAGRSADGTPRFAVCDQGNSRIVFFTFPSER